MQLYQIIMEMVVIFIMEICSCIVPDLEQISLQFKYGTKSQERNV